MSKFAKMKQRLNEVANDKGSSNSGKSYSDYLFKPKKVTNKYPVRIVSLPMKDGQLDSRFDVDLNPFVIVGSWQDGVGLLPYKGKMIPALPSKNDPIRNQRIQYFTKAKKTNKPSEAEKLKSLGNKLKESLNYYCYVLDRTDDSTGSLQIWKISEKRAEAIMSAGEAHQLAKAKKIFFKSLSKQTKVEISDEDLDNAEEIFDATSSLDECIDAYREIVEKLGLKPSFIDKYVNEVYDIDVFSAESGYDLILEVVEGTFTNPITKKVYDTKEIKSFSFSMTSTPIDDIDELYKTAPHILDDMFLSADVETLQSILDEFKEKLEGTTQISSTKSKKQEVDFDDEDEDEEDEEEPKPVQKKVVQKTILPVKQQKPVFEDDDDEEEDEKPQTKRQLLTDEEEDDDIKPKVVKKSKPSLPTPVPSDVDDEDDLPFD